MTGALTRRLEMTDSVNTATRSRMMASVRAKNTALELAFRRRLFALGFRFRLHRSDLPGTPDLVFARYGAAMFVHGCFWHYHGCHLSQLPQTRARWWKEKLEANRRRDQTVVARLRKLGWRVLTIWECSFRRPGVSREKELDALALEAGAFLHSGSERLTIPRKPKGGRPLDIKKRTRR